MRSCDLCQRPENEVKQIVELVKDGPCICNRCFGTAAGLMNAAQKPKEEERQLLKPKTIHARLGDYVVGQDSARKDLAVAVYNHYKRREALKRNLTLDVEIQKSNVLILGPSGTGKTQMARTLARLLKVPFFVGDATRLTQTGYVGEDVESLIQGLITAAGNDPEKAEWGIVYLDELDKIARKSGREASGYRDVTGEAVQQSLLKLLEGTEVTISKGGGPSGMGGETHTIDTSNILFICAGSFAGIEGVVSRRKNQNSRLGFGAEARQNHTSTETYQAVEEEDLLEFGIIPEMLGRIPVRTTTLPLTEDEMVRILTEPKDAIIRQVKALFEMDGIDLQFDDEALRTIGQKAIKSTTGARALRTIVEQILKPYAFDCPSDPTVKGIRITKETVERVAEAAILHESPEATTLAVQAG